MAHNSAIRPAASPDAHRAGCTLDPEMKGRGDRRRDRLLELEDVERRLKPLGRRYVGLREIPLDALVGTDGRAELVHP